MRRTEHLTGTAVPSGRAKPSLSTDPRRLARQGAGSSLVGLACAIDPRSTERLPRHPGFELSPKLFGTLVDRTIMGGLLLITGGIGQDRCGERQGAGAGRA